MKSRLSLGVSDCPVRGHRDDHTRRNKKVKIRQINSAKNSDIYGLNCSERGGNTGEMARSLCQHLDAAVAAGGNRAVPNDH